MLKEIWSVKLSADVSSVALSPDAQLIACGTYEEVYLFERAGGKLVRKFPGDGYSLAFGPDSMTLAVGGNRCLEIYEVRSGALLKRLEAFGNSVESVAFSDDGSLLGVASHDGSFQLYPARPMNVHRRILTSQWQLLQKFCFGNWVNGVAFHPRAERVAVCSRDGTMRVYDPWNARQELLYEGEAFQRWPVSVSYSTDGLMLASGWSDGGIQIHWNIDHSTGSVLEGHSDWVRGLGWLDSEHLASGSHDGSLQVWHAETGAVMHRHFPHEKKSVYTLATHPKEHLLLTGGWDQMARLWKFQTSPGG